MKKTLVIFALSVLSFTARAQRDHVGKEAFKMDSLEIHLIHWHTQNDHQNTLNAKQFVLNYFSVTGDSLFAEIPKGYKWYEVDDPMSGGRNSNKTMITFETGKETKWFRLNDLYGKKVFICLTTKQQAILFLSL